MRSVDLDFENFISYKMSFFIDINKIPESLTEAGMIIGALKTQLVSESSLYFCTFLSG